MGPQGKRGPFGPQGPQGPQGPTVWEDDGNGKVGYTGSMQISGSILFSNTNNICVGQSDRGAYNTTIGLETNTCYSTGTVSVGYRALRITGNGYNTGVGFKTMHKNHKGSYNTAIGANAGESDLYGSNNTYLGANTDVEGGNYSNSTAIGCGATITASNQVVIGTGNELIQLNGTTMVSGATELMSDMTVGGNTVISGGVAIAGPATMAAGATIQGCTTLSTTYIVGNPCPAITPCAYGRFYCDSGTVQIPSIRNSVVERVGPGHFVVTILQTYDGYAGILTASSNLTTTVTQRNETSFIITCQTAGSMPVKTDPVYAGYIVY
jgi:acetyltransferase-like isoleucine patch superfamily enzyme